MSVPAVSLNRWKTPSPVSRAPTISGRDPWLSSVRSCCGVCDESPTTRPSSATSVTRLALLRPRRSASSSRDPSASECADEISCAISRASSVSRWVMAARCRSLICQESRSAATMTETAAAPTAAMKTFARKLVYTFARSGVRLGVVRDQLVAELLDGDEPIDEDRQLFAQPADVDVDGAGAAGV